MFGGKFDFLRFSLRDTDEYDAHIKADFRENVHGLVTWGHEVGIRTDFRALMNSDVILTRGALFEARFREHVESKISGLVAAAISAALRENINAASRIGADRRVSGSFRENMNARLNFAQNEAITANFRENMNFIYNPQIIDVPIKAHFREVVEGIVSVDITEFDYAIIDVTIPPGGVLRIDSENYTVLLDSLNRIHLHRGDWVTLTRGAIELAVLTNGRLEGDITYVERYL